MYFKISKNPVLLIALSFFLFFSAGPSFGKSFGNRRGRFFTRKSNAHISGILKDRESGMPLAGVPLKLEKNDGILSKRRLTSLHPEGQFLFKDLPDGTYEINSKGYEFMTPAIITISEGEDVNDLILFAQKSTKKEKNLYKKDPIPDHNPALTKDEAGNLYLVWEHGNELWWANDKGKGWEGFEKIADAEGTNPVLIYDRGLLGQGTTAGLLCAWESLSSPKKIISSIGELGEDKILWSKPQALTEDDNHDFGLALAMDKKHRPVILWLQQASIMEDDADLYYQTLSLSDIFRDGANQIQQNQETGHVEQNQEGPEEPEPVQPIISANCYERVLIGGDFLVPRGIPLLGGLKGFAVLVDICEDPGFDPQITPSTSYFFPAYLNEIHFHLEGRHIASDTIFFALNESVVKANAGQAKEVLRKTTQTFGGTQVFDFLSFPFPLILCFVPIGRTRIGASLQIGAEVAFVYNLASRDQEETRLDLSCLPDEIITLCEISTGGTGTISCFRGKLSGQIYVLGGMSIEYTLSSSSVKILVAPFTTLAGFIRIGGDWNGILRTFDRTTVREGKTFTFPDPNNSFSDPNNYLPDPNKPALAFNNTSFTSFKTLIADSVRERLLNRGFGSVADDVSAYEELEFTKKPFQGKRAIYEGKSVLKEVQEDIYQDGLPSVAKNKAGELILTWTKDFASQRLGTKVYIAEYDGNSWGAPVEITPDISFNQDPIVVFDSLDIPMIVWSSASNHGLDYEKSSVAEILKAIDKTDLMYSRRIDGKWAAPKILTTLSGKDEQIHLASGPDGEITAAWINSGSGGSTIYSSFWNGKKWAEPTRIAKAALAELPKVIYQSEKPFIIWSQDRDNNVYTFDDWAFYTSHRKGSSWSLPLQLFSKIRKKICGL